jgi:GT2 family glycosyltransferase
MKNKVDISIVIVSWNAKKYLTDCVESLLSQESSRTMEIIVVDNASTDGSPEVIMERFPEVILIQNEKNLGFAKANNIGINRSTGKYICLINSDIKILNGCILKLYYFMEENSPAGIIGPKILNSDLSSQSSCRRFPSLWNNFCSAFGLNKISPNSKEFSGEQMFYFQHNRVERVHVVSGCFMMVRRKALDQVGYLDDQFFMYSEDIDWCKRFWDAGWEVAFSPNARAIHYGGASSSNSPIKFSVEQEKAILQYWAKHHSRPAQSTIFLIIFIKHVVRILLGSLLYILKPSDRRKITLYIKEHITYIYSLFHS